MDNGFIGNLRNVQNNLGGLAQRNTQNTAPSAPAAGNSNIGQFVGGLAKNFTQAAPAQASRVSTGNTPVAGSYTNNPLNYEAPNFMSALNGDTAPKSRVSRIYKDGGVDVRIPISDANNRWVNSYEQYHISGKNLKNALQGAYNGKYTGSEVKNLLNDSGVLENIYTNIGATLEYNDDQKGAITSLIDSYLDKKSDAQQPTVTPEVTEKVTETSTPEGEKVTDTVDYTYKPGDNFGNVLIKMGLSDGRNLWGPNGDVAYYTQQLNDQGIYGNIPIGTKIRLRKRA